jgi:hypothetical protein
MKTPLLIALLLLLISFQRITAQSDSVTITRILNKQIASADKHFGKQPYVLNRSTVPFDTTRHEFLPNSEYTRFLCGKYMTWTNAQITSATCTVETDATQSKDYSCFISTPIFNSDKTACRVYMSCHYSEWGGGGYFYFYQKKHSKWKRVRTSLLWVS